MQQYFSELGLPKGMLEILPGITQARVVAQGGLCLQFTGPSAMFRGLASKAYDLGNFGLQHVGEVCVLSSRGSFLTSERCSNISLNLVCPRACWRYSRLRVQIFRQRGDLRVPRRVKFRTPSAQRKSCSYMLCCDFGVTCDCSQGSKTSGHFSSVSARLATACAATEVSRPD